MPLELSPIPFGTQYYRAPTPLPKDWDKDMAVIKDTGLDCVKLWVQWRWNHPANETMDFSDIQGLCDTAHKHGLKVLLNAILDVAPTWLYEAFPDAYMVTCNGVVARSEVTACRQIGGSPGPCYHHAGAWNRAWDFLTAAAQKFRDHPAVWGWDIWNEPELSMMNRYACEGNFGNMLCYCDSTRQAFADWLLRRYGSLEAINAAHGRNYLRPELIEMPRSNETYRDFIDWRLFFRDTLADNMRRRAEIVRRCAPDQRVVTHSVPPIALTVANSSSDEWKLAEPVEEFGCSFPLLAPISYEADVNRSSAKGKRLWSAEFYPGTGDNPEVSADYTTRMHRLVFLPLFRGYKAYLIWQWRGEQLGREGGWGVHYGLPQPTWPAIRHLKGMVDILRDHGTWLQNAQPARPHTAILFNPESELMAYALDSRSRFYQDSMVGLHGALDASNLPVHFVHADEAAAGGLKGYQVLVMPFPVWVSAEAGEAIRQWVNDGGTLISEAHFAGRDPSNGFTWETIPGLGFDKVFGARQAGFRGGRGTNEERVELTTRADLPGLPAGARITGLRLMEALQPTTAEVLAVHADGRAAITRNRYGKGQAVLIGTYPGAAYRANADAALERLLLSLLPAQVEQDRPIVTPGADRPVVITLGESDQQWVYVENRAAQEQTFTLSLPGPAPVGRLRNLLGEGVLELSPANGRRTGTVTLPGATVAMFAPDGR